ncbi:MAG: type II secretion system protein [Alphaproteobacteria bacterium]
MLKENKYKIVISQVVGKSAGNKALNTAGCWVRSGMTECGETGRSMVEMLGVLAIMGVLSVGGVAMYTTAMNKHRANELLNEASKRAAVLAMQITAGKVGNDLSIGEFTNPSGYIFGVDGGYAAGGKTFKLTLSKDPSGAIDDTICAQMKAALGDNSAMAIDDTCATLTFNADMSRGVDAGGASPSVTCDPPCTGGKECVNGSCECPSATPIWNGTECQVKTTCSDDEYYWPELNVCTEMLYCENADADMDETNKKCSCPSGKYAYLEAGWPACCPDGNSIVLGRCAPAPSCDGEWYCDGELEKNGENCIDQVKCCSGTVLTKAGGSMGGFQTCCPDGLNDAGDDCSKCPSSEKYNGKCINEICDDSAYPYYWPQLEACTEEYDCQGTGHVKNGHICTCASGYTPFLSNDRFPDCCPSNHPIVYSRCAPAPSCDGEWSCPGGLYQGTCVDPVECCPTDSWDPITKDCNQ